MTKQTINVDTSKEIKFDRGKVKSDKGKGKSDKGKGQSKKGKGKSENNSTGQTVDYWKHILCWAHFRDKSGKNPNVFAVPLPWRSNPSLLAIQNPTHVTGVTNHEKSNFEHVTLDFTYFPFTTVFITRLKIRLKGDYNELYHLNKKQIYLFSVESYQLDDCEYRS